MIWLITLLTWGLATILTQYSHRSWKILAGITLILSLGMYYYLGHPNLPDHPYTALIKLKTLRNHKIPQ